MRNIGIFAFGVTTCVLLPTARHLLEAGPKQVAKLVAPGQTTLTVGKARVDVSVDRAFIDAGDKVHVKLAATADPGTRQRVTLDVLVLESTGTGGSRVETPPNRIARETVTLDLRSGSATKQLAFTLRGERGLGMEGLDPFGHYAILVLPPADADKLEQLRRRADRVANPMEDRDGRIEAFEQAYRSIPRAASERPDDGDQNGDGAQPASDDDAQAFGTPGQIARLDVNTRPTDSPISIHAPETARAGQDIAVKVRVRNPSKFAVADLEVSLSGRPYLDDSYRGIDEDHVAIADNKQSIALKGHETKDLVFHVSASTAGTLALFATARCESEDCYAHPTTHRLSDSALDAVDIVAADPQTIVGSK